jgi:hypothetical protein
MDVTTSDTGSDILSLASWEKERSSEELRSFVELRHAALPADITLE